MAERQTFKGLVALGLAAGVLPLLGGCSLADFPILSAAGPIASQERDILFRAIAIMMIVVIPVFVMAAWFGWRYRASNSKANYQPDWTSNAVDAVVWAVPALIVASLGVHVWISTHKLDPYKPLDAAVPPLEVQVVAEDWKWLFIYPQQGIAVVNELAFPSGTPLSLKITSDTVMNAFSIPALGGQIYAMAGMQSQLNLLAGAPGTFRGRNTQYSGGGFADQHFDAIAMSQEDFDAWVAKVRAGGGGLDAAAYADFAKPSRKQPVTTYATVEPGLFGQIIAKYDSTMTGHSAMAGK
jgi:cytochrome o ubiquinol oxidase subunit II